MNIILGLILVSLKKLSRKDRGKMLTARPRSTRNWGRERGSHADRVKGTTVKVRE